MRLFLNICSCICYLLSFYLLFVSDWEDSKAASIVIALWGVGFILQAHSFPSRTFNPENWFKKKWLAVYIVTRTNFFWLWIANWLTDLNLSYCQHYLSWRMKMEKIRILLFRIHKKNWMPKVWLKASLESDLLIIKCRLILSFNWWVTFWVTPKYFQFLNWWIKYTSVFESRLL